MFQEAQDAMDEVLKNGRTMTETRKAYFEKASMTRNQMEKLTNQQTVIENNTSTLIVEPQIILEDSEESHKIKENFPINGTASNLGNGNTIVSVYVNGNWIQFLINGTQITQLNNTGQN